MNIKYFCSALFCTEDGSVFLQVRDKKSSTRNPGEIGTFGGAVLLSESPMEALHRELAEELNGYKAENPWLFGIYSINKGDETWQIHVFKINETKSKLSKLKVTEGQGGVFVGKNDLDKHNFSDNAMEILKDYFNA